MKKTIYLSGSASIVILSVMFYFHSVSSNTSNDLPVDGNQNFIQNGNNQSSFSPQSGGWQLQVMPNMGNRLIRDLYFTDSLTGYAVASPESYTDSAHILETTNGGFNWSIKYTSPGRLPRIIFLNPNTGFAGGNKLLKTTDAGENWFILNKVFSTIVRDMFVFSEDTIWYGDSDPFAGGLFRTTNGGINWEKRDSGIPANSYPDKIYFYNSRIGFAYHGGVSFCYKTTNSGENWFQINSADFVNIYFVDSLKGFRSASGFFKTSNGGLNWSKDSLPSITGNTYTLKAISSFIVMNEDTIYCTGGAVYYYSNGIYRNIIYKSTNGGINWGYQIPDTNYQILQLNVINNYKNFIWIVDKFNNRLVYSSKGGDSTVYVRINQISNEVPEEYELHQNFPNPFNPRTVVRFSLFLHGGRTERAVVSTISIKVYDINGREVQTLVSGRMQAGTYEAVWDGTGFPSGVYFCRMVTEGYGKTIKMVLSK